MNTPICDFVKKYAAKKTLRLHMPAHKGKKILGFEKYDITEIDGADDLYSAKGIIAESEKNAGELFGADTFYSAEGSSLAIRAMLYLARSFATASGKSPTIVAARNAHRSFISAAALLNLDVRWIFGNNNSYLSCDVTAETVEAFLAETDVKPFALYITSPDYLGNLADIAAISEVCKKADVMLLVDNAHGAYLKFLTNSLHPMDLGATMCADSAHKTLPSITGSAYLHIAKSAPEFFKENAELALSLFGSSSPSYLILQSLDRLNAYLADGFKQDLTNTINGVSELKTKLLRHGYTLIGDEQLKITLAVKPYGYTGEEFNGILQTNDVVCEFYDADFVVLMISSKTSGKDLLRLEKTLLAIPQKDGIITPFPTFNKPEKVMTVRQALLSVSESVEVDNACGRVLSFATVHCPPAVPILVGGERIDENAVKAFKYYGINSCSVVK